MSHVKFHMDIFERERGFSLVDSWPGWLFKIVVSYQLYPETVFVCHKYSHNYESCEVSYGHF